MLGYDRKLFLARARTFVLSVHTLHLAEVTMLDFSAATLASAQQLWFETHGKLRSYEDGRIKVGGCMLQEAFQTTTDEALPPPPPPPQLLPPDL